MSERRTGLDWLPVILSLLLAVAALTVAALYIHLSPRYQQLPPQPSQLGTVPDGRIFGLSAIRGVVQSPYAYESNLLDDAAPVCDCDYLLPYAAQEAVLLPGGSWDRYFYEGAVYVQGSGWVLKWRAPNGGHFAFLHIRYATVSTSGLPQLVFVGGQQQPFAGYDETGSAVGGLPVFVPEPSRSATFTGKTQVGYSGWPDWSQYANGGVPGPWDAHLCVLMDEASYQWFYQVAAGHDPRPTSFPRARWNHYRSAHHLAPVPYKQHGALTWAASVWIKHRYLGGIKNAGRWEARNRLMSYPFELGTIYAWPRYGTVKVVGSRGRVLCKGACR